MGQAVGFHRQGPLLHFVLFHPVYKWVPTTYCRGNQGCALAEPGSPWHLTFAPWRLKNLSFLNKTYAEHPTFCGFRALGSLQFSLEHSFG